MFGGLFKRKLKSNQPINSAVHPSAQVQDQMKALQQLQQQNMKNAQMLDDMPDFQNKSIDLLRQNEEFLRRSR